MEPTGEEKTQTGSGSKRITNGIKISFYIPREWHEEMKKIAEETKASVSYHYRIAVKEYIERYKVASK